MPTCAIPKGLSLQPSPCGVGVRAIPKELSPGSILCRIRSDVIGTKRPASRDRFEGAVRQTHHMQEIERLLRQITNLSAHEVRTNLLFTMSKQNKRQARRSPQTFLRMTFFISTQHLRAIRRIVATATIPSGLREWWSRTGSNRRHPACKAGALPAELRPLIPCRGDPTILADCRIGGPGRT